jgi:hypothetical protein
MVRQRVAMDQCANVAVLRDEDPAVRGSFSQERQIAGICPPLAHVQHIVTDSPQRAHGLCNDVRIGKDAHTLGRRS